MKENKSFIKKYKWSFIFVLLLMIIYLMNNQIGNVAVEKTYFNFASMLKILPPIMLLIGLLDVWVPKETMIKYMGKDSGIKGIGIALILGSLAAGPLYAAFPIAAILMKKRARFAYVLFFLGVWSSTKLPMLMFEVTSFGVKFTTIHVVSNLFFFLAGALLIEKLLKEETIEEVYQSAEEIA